MTAPVSHSSDIVPRLPGLPASLHLVGIGGIGMSGLAQLLQHRGYSVSGSDRDAGREENRRIVGSLERQGIEIFPQDGSGPRTRKPDLIVYSTAVEEGNPDFAAVPDIPRMHRAHALAAAIADGGMTQIAVAGSCGKTTVTAWAAETLALAGLEPGFLVGGLVNRFADDVFCGNFRTGKRGSLFLYEADESDKSLLQYRPDYSILLNIGTDHYEKAELLRVFRAFLKNTVRGAVIEAGLVSQLGPDSFAHLDVRTFSQTVGDVGPADWRLASCSSTSAGQIAETSSGIRFALPIPGIHNATNGLAILALFDLIGVEGASPSTVAPRLSEFRGVWRRFEIHGSTHEGATIIDDYAHNVEKILSSIRTAKALAEGQLLVIFQPHGFGPLKFMEQELFAALEAEPDERQTFAFLPVYYSGGTTSFSPKSQDVVGRFAAAGKRKYLSFESRADAECFLRSRLGSGDTLLILGARDNSLSDWARGLARVPRRALVH
jgi:UDP-N-acetylmuramate--alanine ligase